MTRTLHHRRRALGVLTVFCLSLAACDALNDITGLDGSGDPIQFSRDMTLGEFEETLGTSAARVEIELFADGLIAHRVVLGRAEALAEAEEIESLIIGIEAGESEGSVSLTLGDLQVTFDEETRFATGGDELSFGQFVERVEAILGEGYEPRVKAERQAPAEPQAPADASFRADELTLVDDIEAPEIEINVGTANLQVNVDPGPGEPDGWINVLGLSIELWISDGVTELGSEDVEVLDAVEFEGHVSSANVDAGTFTFSDGTVVRVTDDTQIFEAESDIPITSLAGAKEALEAGHDVVAWGGGELESEEPRVIVALELRFAVHGGDDSEIVEFEGIVTSVNLDAGSFTLTNGTIVYIVDATELILEGEGETLTSLEAVWAALEAGDDVIAYGAGAYESSEPLTLVALEMRFVLHRPEPPIEDFEGFVESVNVDGGFFTLTNGIVVHMAEDTEIKQAEQGEPLMSLAAVKEALDGGASVVAWGDGEVEGVEPLTLIACQVYFVLSD